MHRLAPFALLLALAASGAAATTLCQRGESDYFSCTLRDGRRLSVCGHVDDTASATEWLQVRMGQPGKLAFAWPKERAGSTQRFEGNVFPQYDVSDLRFVVGDRLYDISLTSGGDPDAAGGRVPPGAEMGWQRADGTHGGGACRHPDFQRYAEPFETLNVTLHRRRPLSDLLSTLPDAPPGARLNGRR